MKDGYQAHLFSKAKELYWTVTRALGLGFLHDGRGRARHLIYILAYPLYKVAAFSLRFSNVRFIDARFDGAPYGIVEHIGHCAMDFDCLLKDQELSGSKITPVFLCAGRKPANEALIHKLSDRIRFVRGFWADAILRPLLNFPEIVVSAAGYNATYEAARTFDVQDRWNGRPPLFSLTRAEVERGEAQLRLLGVPEGEWFVCIHSREGGYIPEAEWQHSFRNSCIHDYIEAMDEIVRRGGWCVRVGDRTMQPLKPRVGVIDYVHSASKSDWMDVFLCARCRFFLGNTSGLFGLAGIFGRPVALANMTPLACAYAPFPEDLAIPKLLVDQQGEMLPLEDAFAGDACNMRHSFAFSDSGLRVVDNTPTEIAELAQEMLDRLDGRHATTADDDALQTRFRALFGPSHYAWGASSKIGGAFLRRHRGLLPAGPNQSSPNSYVTANSD